MRLRCTLHRRESIFVLSSVLSLRPHEIVEDTPDSTTFFDRSWSLGSIIEDASLKTWIRILNKAGVKKGYAEIKESSALCIHQRAKKLFCLF